MMSPPLVASKHTCYKLVMSLSTRTRNVNALDTCHTRNQLERVFPLQGVYLRLHLPYNSLEVLPA